MVLFYSITVNEYQNTCKSKREKKKELFPFSCNCLFNQWSFLQKKHKTIFNKKKYNVQCNVTFFSKKKLNIPERIHRTAHARLPVNSVGRV